MDNALQFIALTHLGNALSSTEGSFTYSRFEEQALIFSDLTSASIKEIFKNLPLNKQDNKYIISEEGTDLVLNTVELFNEYLKNEFIPNPYYVLNNQNKKYSLEFFETRMILACYYLQAIKPSYSQTELFKITIKMCGVDDEYLISKTIPYHTLVSLYLLPVTQRLDLNVDPARDKYWLDEINLEVARITFEEEKNNLKDMNLNKKYLHYVDKFLGNPEKKIWTNTHRLFYTVDDGIWEKVVNLTRKRIFKLDESVEDSIESCVQSFALKALESDKLRFTLKKYGKKCMNESWLSFWTLQEYRKKKQRKFKNEKLEFVDISELNEVEDESFSDIENSEKANDLLQKINNKLNSSNCSCKTLSRFKATIDLLAQGYRPKEIAEQLNSTKAKVDHDIFRIRKILLPSLKSFKQK